MVYGAVLTSMGVPALENNALWVTLFWRSATVPGAAQAAIGAAKGAEATQEHVASLKA